MSKAGRSLKKKAVELEKIRRLIIEMSVRSSSVKKQWYHLPH